MRTPTYPYDYDEPGAHVGEMLRSLFEAFDGDGLRVATVVERISAWPSVGQFGEDDDDGQ